MRYGTLVLLKDRRGSWETGNAELKKLKLQSPPRRNAGKLQRLHRLVRRETGCSQSQRTSLYKQKLANLVHGFELSAILAVRHACSDIGTRREPQARCTNSWRVIQTTLQFFDIYMPHTDSALPYKICQRQSWCHHAKQAELHTSQKTLI